MLNPARIHIGIPAYCERHWLPSTLESLNKQSDIDFAVWVCVNQPLEYYSDGADEGGDGYSSRTQENLQTLAWLHDHRTSFRFPLHILDAVDPARAPRLKHSGVGWARRYLFNHIAENAATPTGQKQTLCISLDADTLMDENYVAQVRQSFLRYPDAVGLAAPYYHRLPGHEAEARRILRYEIYLRYYQLSLWCIHSPYAFMPIGSAMAFPLRSYLRIGGIPPRKAGEDFYFMQQLRKTGPLIRGLHSCVYPSARVSQRNPFGTGPLMHDDGMALLQERYPFYPQWAFARVAKAFNGFAQIFAGQPVQQALSVLNGFVEQRLKGCQSFDNIRGNFSQRALFIKACHEKFDGLRTLQFLRYCLQDEQNNFTEKKYCAENDFANINELLLKLAKPPLPVLHWQHSALEQLNQVRNTLFAYETELQKKYMQCWNKSWM